jgi:hypothetical protein
MEEIYILRRDEMKLKLTLSTSFFRGKKFEVEMEGAIEDIIKTLKEVQHVKLQLNS